MDVILQSSVRMMATLDHSLRVNAYAHHSLQVITVQKNCQLKVRYTLEEKRVPKEFFLCPVGRTLKGSQYEHLKVLWTPWDTLFGSLNRILEPLKGSLSSWNHF